MKLFTGRRIKKLSKAVEKYPHDLENHFLLADAHLETGDPGEARRVLEHLGSLQEASSATERLQLALARVLLAEERWEEARTSLRGIAAGSEGEIRLEAERLLARSVASSPSEEDGGEEELREARRVLLDEAEAGGSGSAEAWELLAGLARRLGEDEAELEARLGWLRCLPQGSPTEEVAEARLRVGELEEKRDHEEALKHYLKVLEVRPEDDGLLARAYRGIARIREGEEDLLGAGEKLEMALRYLRRGREEENAATTLELARIYLASGRDAQARSEVERAARLRDLPPALRFGLDAWLARDRIRQDRLEQALELATQAEKSRGGLPGEAELLLGEVHQAAGRPEDAGRALKKALARSQGGNLESAIRLPLARALLAQGRASKAVEHAQAALDLAEGDARGQALLVLADTRIESGRVRDGVGSLLQVCEEFPGSRTRDEAMDRVGALRRRLADPDLAAEMPLDAGEIASMLALLSQSDEANVVARLRKGLARTQGALAGGIERLLVGRTEIDEELLEELEAILIQADLGVETTESIIQTIRQGVARQELREPERIKDHIKRHIQELLEQHSGTLDTSGASPYVIMVVGVNGVGKTTTIAKLAKRITDGGATTLLAAGDTFRAGAIEQILEWGRRLGVEVIHSQSGADPSSVAFDAAAAAESRQVDVLIVDTAGRLHTKVNLMEELKKIRRVIDSKLPGAPHEVLLVLDGTTGQNAINQAKIFGQAVDVTGLILTKLDGTAKGGIVVRITQEFGIPVKFIGIGEKMDDLREFVAEDFVEAIFG